MQRRYFCPCLHSRGSAVAWLRAEQQQIPAPQDQSRVRDLGAKVPAHLIYTEALP